MDILEEFVVKCIEEYIGNCLRNFCRKYGVIGVIPLYTDSFSICLVKNIENLLTSIEFNYRIYPKFNLITLNRITILFGNKNGYFGYDFMDLEISPFEITLTSQNVLDNVKKLIKYTVYWERSILEDILGVINHIKDVIKKFGYSTEAATLLGSRIFSIVYYKVIGKGSVWFTHFVNVFTPVDERFKMFLKNTLTIYEKCPDFMRRVKELKNFVTNKYMFTNVLLMMFLTLMF